jgi:threonine dehydrogenase-like Zn-dependent dehydrogenase
VKAWEVRQGQLGFHDVDPPRGHIGEAEVRVSYVGICGSDLPKLIRPAEFALPEPWRPGHEIVGVDAAGRAVAVDPLIPCKRCQRCTLGDTHLCQNLRRLGWDVPGGFAERVAVPRENLRPLPQDLDPLHAVLADPAAVAVHGLRCNYPKAAPERLAVIGAGAVGVLTALYVAQRGSLATIIHRDGRPPSQAVMDAVPAEFRTVSSLADGETFEVVVDAATGEDAGPLELGLRIVSDGGTLIVQNAYHPAVTLGTPLRDVFSRSVHLIGSFSYCRRQPVDDFDEALGLVRRCASQVRYLVGEPTSLLDLSPVLACSSRASIRRIMAVQECFG